MDKQQKVLNAIGLAIKAKKYIFGQRLIENIQFDNQSVQLVIIAKGMGQSAKKKLVDKCRTYHVIVFDNLVDVEQLNKMVKTKSPISAIGITDVNFRKLITSYEE